MPRKTNETTAQPVTLNINTTPTPSPEPEKPETPTEEKPPHWFFSKIAELPAHEWGRVWSLELYRLKPDVPGVPGTKGYLRLFSEPITLETLRTTVGGGRFRLNLCKNGRWHTSHEFEIEGAPIYDTSRERPSANGNSGAGSNTADFQREFISVLREELQRSRENGGGQGTDEVVKMLTSASDKAMEIVTKQTPQAVSGITQIKEMVTALKEMGIIGGQRENGGGSLKETIDLLTTLGLLNKPKSLAEQLQEIKTLGELISGGGGDAAPKDWKAMMAKSLTDHLPEILDAFKANANATISAAQRARQTPAATPATRAAAPQPAGARPAAASPAAAPPAPDIRVDGGLNVVPRDSADAAPAPDASVPTAAAVPGSQEEYDTAMKIQMVNMIRMGASGASIASFLEDVKPEMAADLTKYPRNVIEDFFLKDPYLKLLVEDPHWGEVLTDAREYLAEEVPTN